MPFLIVLLFVAILCWISKTTKPKKFPPGPKWFPLVGSSRATANAVAQYGAQHKAFEELAKHYSTSVLGLKLGSELVVVVFGEECVRDVLTREEFEGRPKNYFMKLRCLGKRIGITGTDGPLWKEHRQFALKHLKNVGFGKQLMEIEIINELDNMLLYIKNNPKSVNLRRLLAPAIMNVMWKFTAGESIREDQRLERILDLLNARSKAFNMSGGWLNQYPWIRYICPNASGYSLICKINKNIMEIISDAIRKHRKNEVKAEDFMYAFLQEIDAGNETYTEEQLSIVCLDLLIAGSQTTSNSLEFAFLMAVRNKCVQEKIINEISETIGDRTPCWADHKLLPYSTAYLLEVQRYVSLVPLLGPRRAMENTTIAGYNIPKDTTILISVHDIHHDPNIWLEPESFNPERFLDGKGGLKDTEHLYHFGMGRRRCPGDSLAKRFMFLIFVGILQRFRVDTDNVGLPTCEPVYGIIASPVTFPANFNLIKSCDVLKK